MVVVFGQTYTSDPYYYFSSNPNASYRDSPWKPRTKREKRLKALMDKFDNNKSKVVQRIQREERERKVTLDARSRARKQSVTTTHDPQRRMQTYEAAMAARQLQR